MAGSASQAGGREVSEVTVIRCTKAPELALWAQAFAPSPQHSVFIPFIQGLFKNKRAGVPWQGAGAASAAPPPLKAPPGMKTVLKSISPCEMCQPPRSFSRLPRCYVYVIYDNNEGCSRGETQVVVQGANLKQRKSKGFFFFPSVVPLPRPLPEPHPILQWDSLYKT